MMIEYHFIYGKGVASQERADWHIIASAPVDFVPLYRRIATDIINPVLANAQPSLSPDTQLLVAVAQANKRFWAYARVFHVGADASGRTLYSYHTLLMSNEQLKRLDHQPWHLLPLMAQKKGRNGFFIGGIDQEITGANPIQLKSIELKSIEPRQFQDTDQVDVDLDQDVSSVDKTTDIKFIDQAQEVGVAVDMREFLSHSGSDFPPGVLSGVSLRQAKIHQANLCRYGIGLVTRLSPPVPTGKSGSNAVILKHASAVTTLAAPAVAQEKASRPANKSETLNAPADAPGNFKAAAKNLGGEETPEGSVSTPKRESVPQLEPQRDPHHNSHLNTHLNTEQPQLPHSQPELQRQHPNAIENAQHPIYPTTGKEWIPWVALFFAGSAFILSLIKVPAALDPDARISELQGTIRALQAKIETREQDVVASSDHAQQARDSNKLLYTARENARRMDIIETIVANLSDEFKFLSDDTLPQLIVGLEEQLADIKADLDTAQDDVSHSDVVAEQMQETSDLEQTNISDDTGDPFENEDSE